MSSPLKQHVSFLDQSLFHEFIAELGGFTWLPSSSQKYPTFFILNRHEVSGYLNVYHIRPVAMRAEVIHEQIVRVVHEEMQCIEHVSIILQDWHFKCLLYDLLYLRLSLSFILNELNTFLLIPFLD